MGMGMGGSHEGYLSDHSDARGRSPRGRRGSSKPPEDPTDVALLSDIPNWLRSLRLHKYTDNLKEMRWQDLVQLDDDGLENRGVNALGARRKLLKVSVCAFLIVGPALIILRSLNRFVKHRLRVSCRWWQETTVTILASEPDAHGHRTMSLRRCICFIL